jgi:hypothetical protein
MGIQTNDYFGLSLVTYERQASRETQNLLPVYMQYVDTKKQYPDNVVLIICNEYSETWW